MCWFIFTVSLFLPLLLHDWPEKSLPTINLPLKKRHLRRVAASAGPCPTAASKTPFSRLNTRAGCNGPIASLVMLRRANCATATGQLPTVRLQVCTRQVRTDGTGSALKINMVLVVAALCQSRKSRTFDFSRLTQCGERRLGRLELELAAETMRRGPVGASWVGTCRANRHVHARHI